jgi:Helix-turn-helix domain
MYNDQTLCSAHELRGPDLRSIATELGARVRPEARQRDRDQLVTIGGRVAELMTEQHLSLATLAMFVRLQESTLANLCAGKRRIPREALETLASVLGTTAEYLNGSTDALAAPAAPPAPSATTAL